MFFFDHFQKDSAEGAKRPEKSINDSLDPKKGKEDNMGEMTPVEENIAAENHPSEPFVSPNPTRAANIAIEKIKLEMEENGFAYLSPRAHQKIAYVHYRRQRIDGRLVYVAHADYYILLRACARLVEVDAQTMHRCVLGLERRLDWIDRQIDELFCNQDGGNDSRTA